MTWFVLSCVVIAAIVLVSLLYSLRNASKEKSDLQAEIELAARRENIEIARERLAALPEGKEYDEDRLELEAALADDLDNTLEQPSKAGGSQSEQPHRSGIRSAFVFLLAIPVAATALYLSLGDTTWLRHADLPSPAEIRANPQQSMTQLLDRLEQTLQEDPDNAAGWSLAGRTYMSMGRYADAEAAYAKANALQANDSELLAAWSDAALLNNGNRYTPEIADRIERALALDANNPNALWIGGMGNISNGEVDKGLGFLERLRPMLAEQPELLQQITAIIDQVRGGQSTSSDSSGSGDPESGGPIILVNLSITPELLAKAPLDTPVFVFARATEGPPMPLAAQRLTVAELPATIQLDESSAMMPARTIGSVDQVEIVARLAFSGQPIKQPGDVTSKAEVIEIRANNSVDILLE